MSTARSREEVEHPGFVIALSDGTFFRANRSTRFGGTYRWQEPYVFTTREEADHLVEFGRFRTDMFLSNTVDAAVVELTWSNVRWSGKDKFGDPIVWRCDDCDYADEPLCMHRGARWCPECDEVRPVEYFTLAPDALGAKWGKPIGPMRHTAHRVELAGVCDTCARRRAEEAAGRLQDAPAF